MGVIRDSPCRSRAAAVIELAAFRLKSPGKLACVFRVEHFEQSSGTNQQRRIKTQKKINNAIFARL